MKIDHNFLLTNRPSESQTATKNNTYTLCLKNVPPLTCYNFDIHDPIAIFFGTYDTEKVRNQMMLCFHTLLIYCFCITLRKRKPRRQRTGPLCTQRSPTVAELSTSFLPNHAPKSPMLNALITRFMVSYSSVSMSRELKRQ